MKKIAAFIASPRQQGFGARLLRRVAEGAEAAGAEVVFYDLNDRAVRGCQSCFYCRSHNTCPQKDALQPMYRDIEESCGIIAAFPIYFAGISGQGKLWVDRLYPFMGPNFTARCPGKKMVTVYAQGNPNPDKFEALVERTNDLFKLFGWEVQDSLLVSGTSGKEEVEAELLERAFEAGKRLAGE